MAQKRAVYTAACTLPSPSQTASILGLMCSTHYFFFFLGAMCKERERKERASLWMSEGVGPSLLRVPAAEVLYEGNNLEDLVSVPSSCCFRGSGAEGGGGGLLSQTTGLEWAGE